MLPVCSSLRQQFAQNARAFGVVFSGKGMVVEHHGRNACLGQNLDSLVVVGVLAFVDQYKIGLERQDLFGVENVVVVPADAGNRFDFGKGLRECCVFAESSRLPTVLWKRHDLFEALGAAHHQEVEDVVAYDYALGGILNGDGSVFQIR